MTMQGVPSAGDAMVEDLDDVRALIAAATAASRAKRSAPSERPAISGALSFTTAWAWRP